MTILQGKWRKTKPHVDLPLVGQLNIITSPTHTSTLSLNLKLKGVNKSIVEATSWRKYSFKAGSSHVALWPLSKQLVGNNACRWTRCDAQYRKCRVLLYSTTITIYTRSFSHKYTQTYTGKQNSSPAAGIGSCFRERARPCVNDGVCESVEERCLLQAISSAKTQKA